MKRILFLIICISVTATCFAWEEVSDMNAHLIKAVIEGNLEAVRFALASGADVNAKRTDGSTALYSASYGGHVEIVKLLLTKGADVNMRTVYGGTALMIAKYMGYEEVVQLLEEAQRGASPRPGTK